MCLCTVFYVKRVGSFQEIFVHGSGAGGSLKFNFGAVGEGHKKS